MSNAVRRSWAKTFSRGVIGHLIPRLAPGLPYKGIALVPLALDHVKVIELESKRAPALGLGTDNRGVAKEL